MASAAAGEENEEKEGAARDGRWVNRRVWWAAGFRGRVVSARGFMAARETAATGGDVVWAWRRHRPQMRCVAEMARMLGKEKGTRRKV